MSAAEKIVEAHIAHHHFDGPAADAQPRPARSLPVDAWDLDMVLDAEQQKLFAAEAIVESVKEALKTRFGRDWPAGIPDYPRALSEAARLIRSAYANLDAAGIENTLAEFNQSPDPDATELAERLADLHQ